MPGMDHCIAHDLPLTKRQTESVLFIPAQIVTCPLIYYLKVQMESLASASSREHLLLGETRCFSRLYLCNLPNEWHSTRDEARGIEGRSYDNMDAPPVVGRHVSAIGVGFPLPCIHMRLLLWGKIFFFISRTCAYTTLHA